jgi:putative chitinase
MAELITKDQLKVILSNAKPENIDKYHDPLQKALTHYSINSPLRIAHFIAQVAQESGSFRYNEEIWPNPTLNPQGVATKGSSWQLKYEGNTGLGNTQPGDGYRFRGRGLIQLTGRANYTSYGKFIQRDLTSGTNSDLVGQPALAVDAAGWFWNTRNLNSYADKDDVLSITKRINGGTLGLEERKAFLVKAKKALGIG